jgi:prevent-host-death family protein
MVTFNPEPDLQTGVLPISSAASSLARRIREARASHRPIVITQKGRPEGVLLSVADYAALVAQAAGPDVADFLTMDAPGDEVTE